MLSTSHYSLSSSTRTGIPSSLSHRLRPLKGTLSTGAIAQQQQEVREGPSKHQQSGTTRLWLPSSSFSYLLFKHTASSCACERGKKASITFLTMDMHHEQQKVASFVCCEVDGFVDLNRMVYATTQATPFVQSSRMGLSVVEKREDGVEIGRGSQGTSYKARGRVYG